VELNTVVTIKLLSVDLKK